MTSATDVLADYFAGITPNDVSSEVFAKTRQLILDFLGCAIGGANLESSKIVAKCFKSKDGRGESTVFLNGNASCEKAAFINAVLSHGLEMDDLNYGAGGHPAVAIMPAAFATAEKVDASGLDLMMALIKGYDMMYRVGEAAFPDAQFKRGLHPTAINGTFGAALASASLLNLKKQQIMNALGIAGSFTSGNLECYSDGSLTKRINPGVASQGGVMAASLASEGYTGPKWIFEGRSGFLVSYSEPDSANKEMLTKDLDHSFNGIMKTGFKPYANCRYNHSSIYAALKMKARQLIDYRDIKEINVKVIQMAIRGVCEPRDVKFNPKNLVDAQFSLPYSMAVIFIRGQAFIEEYTEEMLHNPEIRALMQKVTMEHAPELDPMVEQNAFPSIVTVRLNDGSEFTERVDYCKGDPEEPMTDAELEEKFTSLAGLNISDAGRLKTIIEAVKNLEKNRASDLIALLKA